LPALARELDILTIAVVTVPSPAEGKKRFGQAMEGIEKLGKFVDSMLVVSNQRMHSIFGDLPARQAFKMADDIVCTAVKGVAEIITVHGNVNIDFTDVYTVMHNSSVFIMGSGLASGEGRAMKAVNEALESPLLDSNDIHGTKNILLNIISGKDEITIGEIGKIIETLQEKAGQEADIIWGNGYDESLGDNVSVTILATGFKINPNQLLQPRTEPEKYNLGEEEEKKDHFSEEDLPEPELEEVFVEVEVIAENKKKEFTDAMPVKDNEPKEVIHFPAGKKKRKKKKKSKRFHPEESIIGFIKTLGLADCSKRKISH
jgi:cell division protein FtsZ